MLVRKLEPEDVDRVPVLRAGAAAAEHRAVALKRLPEAHRDGAGKQGLRKETDAACGSSSPSSLPRPTVTAARARARATPPSVASVATRAGVARRAAPAARERPASQAVAPPALPPLHRATPSPAPGPQVPGGAAARLCPPGPDQDRAKF